jgi:hypothetical protein
MDAAQQRPNVNNFGYFLETVEKGGPPQSLRALHTAVGDTADCAPGECTDPQLKILQALADLGQPSCALDLMESTKLPPTMLLETLRTMKEFGLIKLSEAGVGTSADRPPEVELTPCGRRALDLYK